jgi:hypothetical protein
MDDISINSNNHDNNVAGICHLIVLQHGLHGTEDDFQHIAKQLHTNKPQHLSHELLLTLCIKSTAGRITHSGIEELGQMNARELIQFCREKQLESYSTIYLSFIGHSLGGLINRNAIAWLFSSEKRKSLYEDQPATSASGEQNSIYEQFGPFRDKCILTSFISVAAPHLSSRRPGGSFGQNIWRRVVHSYLTKISGRTGKELALEDELIYCNEKKCLLVIMSEPESPYMKVLKQFRFRTALATVHFDITVPFCSASIRSFNPYPVPAYVLVPEFKIIGYSGFNNQIYIDGLLQKYQESSLEKSENNSTTEVDVVEEIQQIEENTLLSLGILKGTEYSEKYDGQDNLNGYFCDNLREVEYIKEILHNLQMVKWRRVDLEFRLQSSIQKGLVHVLPIQKEPKIGLLKSDLLDSCAATCVSFISHLVLIDHNLTKNH